MSMIILIPENVYNELMTGELPEAVSDVFCKKAVEIIDVADKYARYAIENIEEDISPEADEVPQATYDRAAHLQVEGFHPVKVSATISREALQQALLGRMKPLS